MIQYFIVHGLGLCIKVDSYVAHMLYAWSLSHNTAVPIAINNNKYLISLNENAAVFSWGAGISKKKNVTIRFVNMTKLKSKYFKSNSKIHHFNHKWYLALLLKMIPQIQCFILDYFCTLYYNVPSLVLLGVIVYCNHSVIYTVKIREQHHPNNKILR